MIVEHLVQASLPVLVFAISGCARSLRCEQTQFVRHNIDTYTYEKDIGLSPAHNDLRRREAIYNSLHAPGERYIPGTRGEALLL